MVLGPKTFDRHLKRMAHRGQSRRRMLVLSLMLTPMVDMFSLLVIFLLQVFSTSPELLVITQGVTLPTASTGREVKDAPVLSLSSHEVFLDQKRIGSVDHLLKDPEPLLIRLSDLRDLWQKTHPKESFRGEINFQAHKDLPSHTVSQVMAMLPSQGYGSILLAVVGGAG